MPVVMDLVEAITPTGVVTPEVMAGIVDELPDRIGSMPRTL
jgi:hypothetical protein